MATTHAAGEEMHRLDVPANFVARAKRAVKLFFQKASSDGLFDKSGGLAFQALFSIIPMLALAYFIFALSGGLKSVQEDVERFAVSNLAPAVGDQLIGYLQTIQERVSPGAIGIFGILAFLWAGINMISKTEQALNGIWGLRHTRSLKQRLWLYTIVVIAAPLVLGASLAMTSFFASQFDRSSTLGEGVSWLLALAPLALSISFFSLVFWALPYTAVSKAAALKAGAITAILLELLKQGFAFYAAWSLGDSIYGSLAALPILFLWLSIGSTLFLLGAELCYFFDAKEAGVLHVARTESHLSFPMLVDILRLYQKARKPVALKSVVHQLNWDPSEVIQHVQYLADLDLLEIAKGSSIGDECYIATELQFRPAVARVLQQINTVKYENLEIPDDGMDSDHKGESNAQSRASEGRDASRATESGQSLEDRVWSPWGARRKATRPRPV